MEPLSPHALESLVRIWEALHADFRPDLTAADTVYLQRVVLDIEDDLVARLLAAKLSRAARPMPDVAVTAVARTGSRVRFTLDGRYADATLAHGRADDLGLMGSSSRYGAALFGLRAGDAILWPHADHRLVEVRALEVTRCDRYGRRASSAAVCSMRLACASG